MGALVKSARGLLAALSAMLVCMGTAQAAPRELREHYTAELVADGATPAPGGRLAMAIHITPKRGWHIYWSNPGESGYAPAVSWTMPTGFRAGPLRHPTPMRLLAAGLVSYVHEADTVLLQDLTLPADLTVGDTVNLKADIDLLICSEGTCVPDPVTLDTSLTIGSGGQDPAQAGLFARARAALPQSLAGDAQFMAGDGRLQFFLPGVAWHDGIKADLFVEQPGVMNPGGQIRVEPAEGGVLITAKPGDTAPEASLTGVFSLDGKGYRFGAAQAASLPAAGQGGWFAGFDTGFLIAFGTAILGGLILNLMPCVFPILSLKALTLVKYGESESKARIEAMGYALGTIGTVVALGAVLLLLRSGGDAAGWAFQLQNPVVVAGLLLLVVAIATNLAGLFELPGLSVSTGRRDGFLGSVGTGALAAFIATPCTGPFMAGALGAALVMPPAPALAVMAGLGIGMALPFVVLGFFRQARQWLPRPGNWMNTLRRLLSLPMFATALGLAWIIGRQGGVGAMSVAISAAMVLALGLWWYGLRQHGGKHGLPAAAVAMAAVAMVTFGVTPAPAGAVAQAEADTLGSQPFSEARLSQLTGQGKPVFLYLTADWCLSCKVNEATSLSSAEVARAFTAGRVTVLRGDWTRQDPAISAFLKTQGRAGVPLYLWYEPGKAPRELPQVLSPSMLTALTRNS